MQTALDIASTTSIGLLVGVEFTVSAFINPVLVQVGGLAEAQATQLFTKKLGALMPFWYVGCFVLLIAQGVLRRGEGGMPWIGVSAGLWLLVIVLTLIFLVPINNRIVGMAAEEYGPAMRAQHTRWDRLHRGSVAMLALALILLEIGIRM